jgi:hypothetical protein
MPADRKDDSSQGVSGLPDVLTVMTIEPSVRELGGDCNQVPDASFSWLQVASQ